MLFTAGVVFPALANNAAADTNTYASGDIVGAVCVIRHDNKMVMLSEVITRKISLPGGYIDKGDTPEQTAAREALEETGIKVKVGDLLQYRGRAAIYSCVAESPVLVSSFKDHTGHPIVASWFAKHFATEIQRVYLIDPDTIEPEEYRYPKDAFLLVDWVKRTPASEVVIYSDLSDQVNTLHRLELEWIRQLQQFIKSWPDSYQTVFDGIMFVMNLPGESLFITLLVVVVAGFYGTQGLLKLALLLLLATFTASLIKLGVASPRPSYIIPELQQINAYGFGFPSGHTLIATILWGMCWYELSQRVSNTVKWLSFPFFMLLIFCQAFARVWYGVHFISDTLMSILLGFAIVAVLIVWQSMARASFQQCIVNKWFWLSMAMASGISAGLTLAPLHVYVFAVLLGIVLSVETVVESTVASSFKVRLLAAGILLVGLIAVGYGVELLSGLSTVSLIALVIRGGGCMLAAIWLVAGSSFISKKLAIKYPL